MVEIAEHVKRGGDCSIMLLDYPLCAAALVCAPPSFARISNFRLCSRRSAAFHGLISWHLDRPVAASRLGRRQANDAAWGVAGHAGFANPFGRARRFPGCVGHAGPFRPIMVRRDLCDRTAQKDHLGGELPSLEPRFVTHRCLSFHLTRHRLLRSRIGRTTLQQSPAAPHIIRSRVGQTAPRSAPTSQQRTYAAMD